MASHTQDDGPSAATGAGPSPSPSAPRGRPVGRVGQRVGPFLLEERMELRDAIGLYRATRPAGSREPREVAIRIVEDARNDRAAAWVRHEYDILLRLNHPGVPRAFGYYSSQVGVAMSVPPPFRLDSILAASRTGAFSISPATALEIVQEVASILRHAHGIAGPDGPICHGHLSPTNIGLQADGTVTVLGFGAPPSETPMGYRPPEQVVGAFSDARSDQWRLGALLMELLLGVAPYDGLDDPEPAAVEGLVEPWIRRLERRHPDVARVAAKLLAPAAGSRYESEGALIRDLLELTRHQSESPDRRTLLSHLRAREQAKARRIAAAEEARRQAEEAANPSPAIAPPGPEYIETPPLADEPEPRTEAVDPTPVAPTRAPATETPAADVSVKSTQSVSLEPDAPTERQPSPEPKVVAVEAETDQDSLEGPQLDAVLGLNATAAPEDDPLSSGPTANISPIRPEPSQAIGVTWEEEDEPESAEDFSLGLGRVHAPLKDGPSLGPVADAPEGLGEPMSGGIREAGTSEPSMETTDILDGTDGGSVSAGPRPMKWFPSELAAMAAIGVAVIVAIFFIVWRFG